MIEDSSLPKQAPASVPEVLDSRPEPLLTVDDVAKFYVVSKATIYKWVREGRIESVRIGKVLRFPRSVIHRP